MDGFLSHNVPPHVCKSCFPRSVCLGNLMHFHQILLLCTFPSYSKNLHLTPAEIPTQVSFISNRRGFPTFRCEKTHTVHFCLHAKPTSGKNVASSEDYIGFFSYFFVLPHQPAMK